MLYIYIIYIYYICIYVYIIYYIYIYIYIIYFVDGDKEDASKDENVVDLSIQDSNIIVW